MMVFYPLIIFEFGDDVFAEMDTKLINDELFFVSKPYLIQDEPNKIITFHGVNFTIPYVPDPPPPGGIRSTTITFPNGEIKKLSQGIMPEPTSIFAQGFGLKAGFLRDAGFIFLVSINSEPPLKQFKSGISLDDIQCKDNLVLIQKHDGSPACVKPETKIKLVERGWVKTTTLQEIDDSSDSLNLNIARIEDGLISLYPENTCASLDLNRLTAQDIQRYKNDEKGLDENNILQITSKDLKEIPNIQELIYAVHSIEFPYNKYSSASLDGMTFVEYELFLMDKSMKKYGDSKGDYFKKLDGDYEERFTNPAKQGFTNHFEAPVILYNDDAYSVSGTYFWTSDEHEPRRMSFFPIDDINDDEKFITLTDEDMKSVPKIKDAIASIGTIKESVSASKGLPEDQWNQYREWFKQKSQDSLNSDRFRLIQYDNHLYSIGFGIC